MAGHGTEMFEGSDLGPNRLILSPGFIADANISWLHAEAEFCVFSFDSALTSGSMMLALTLSKPMIVPEFPSLMEVFEGGPAPLGCTPGDPGALAAVLARAAGMTPDEIAARSTESLRIARAHDPGSISRRLERPVCGEGPSAPAHDARDRIA